MANSLVEEQAKSVERRGCQLFAGNIRQHLMISSPDDIIAHLLIVQNVNVDVFGLCARKRAQDSPVVRYVGTFLVLTVDRCLNFSIDSHTNAVLRRVYA